MIEGSDPHQAAFHARWGHLHQPQVRDLAWLLDAPDMLDPDAAQWSAQIASFGADTARRAAEWLMALDADPQPLLQHLQLRPLTRLGRYAEQLLALYFEAHGRLQAQGLQVREGGITIGEFDFLLRDGAQLLHWELATKYYLLQRSAPEPGLQADYFVGPNLADTLGRKMARIFDRQLQLAKHSAAQALLPQPIARAQALVKGWLFYGEEEGAGVHVLPGASTQHCRGFWCELSAMSGKEGESFLPLARLEWLSPRRSEQAGMSLADLRAQLEARFGVDSMPVLVAVLQEQGGSWLEARRGFVVPDDWAERAGRRPSLSR